MTSNQIFPKKQIVHYEIRDFTRYKPGFVTSPGFNLLLQNSQIYESSLVIFSKTEVQFGEQFKKYFWVSNVHLKRDTLYLLI